MFHCQKRISSFYQFYLKSSMCECVCVHVRRRNQIQCVLQTKKKKRWILFDKTPLMNRWIECYFIPILRFFTNNLILPYAFRYIQLVTRILAHLFGWNIIQFSADTRSFTFSIQNDKVFFFFSFFNIFVLHKGFSTNWNRLTSLIWISYSKLIRYKHICSRNSKPIHNFHRKCLTNKFKH